MSSLSSTAPSSTASTPRRSPTFHDEDDSHTSQPSSSLPSPHHPPQSAPTAPPTVFQLDQSDVSYVSARLRHYVALYESDVDGRLQSLVLRHQSDSQTITAQSAAIQQLQQRLEAADDAAHSASEQSSLHEAGHTQLRDRYIAHLARQHRLRNITSALHTWRQAVSDSRTAHRRTQRHRTRQLQRATFALWRSNARTQRRDADVSHWRQQLSVAHDAAVREKADEVRRLKEELSALMVAVRMHESDKADAEERMRQAFVRGVCALNKEALGVFGAAIDQPNPHHPHNPPPPDTGTGKEEKTQHQHDDKWPPHSTSAPTYDTSHSTTSSLSSIAHTSTVSSPSHNQSVITFQPIPLRLSHPYRMVASSIVVSSSAVGVALRRSVSAVGGSGSGGGGMGGGGMGGVGGLRGVRAASTKR